MSVAGYKAIVKTWKDALVIWVEAQSGLKVQWRDDTGGYQPKTRARLHLFGIDNAGVDVIRWNVDGTLPAGSDLVPTFAGMREITLSIRVTSRSHKDGAIALTYLDKLRTSLRKTSVRDALRAAGLAHATTSPPVDLTSLVDDRIESQAQMDVLFNAVINERDPDEAGSYVETYKITSDLTDVDGNPHHDDGEDTYP